MEIKIGDWIMKEGMMIGSFSHPLRVTDVKGSRVYFVRIRRTRDGEVEEDPGYCQKKSVRYVVETEEAGQKFWEFVAEAREREMREIREIQSKYTNEINAAAKVTPGLTRYTVK